MRARQWWCCNAEYGEHTPTCPNAELPPVRVECDGCRLARTARGNPLEITRIAVRQSTDRDERGDGGCVRDLTWHNAQISGGTPSAESDCYAVI